MKKLLIFLMAAMLLALAACSGTDTAASAGSSEPTQSEPVGVQYDYQLKAGETTEVYDVTLMRWSP